MGWQAGRRVEKSGEGGGGLRQPSGWPKLGLQSRCRTATWMNHKCCTWRRQSAKDKSPGRLGDKDSTGRSDCHLRFDFSQSQHWPDSLCTPSMLPIIAAARRSSQPCLRQTVLLQMRRWCEVAARSADALRSRDQVVAWRRWCFPKIVPLRLHGFTMTEAHSPSSHSVTGLHVFSINHNQIYETI